MINVLGGYWGVQYDDLQDFLVSNPDLTISMSNSNTQLINFYPTCIRFNNMQMVAS